MDVLAAVAAFFVGIGAGLFLGRRKYGDLRRSVRAGKEKGESKKKTETMKKVVWLCLGHGFVWVWCSYILAYLDRPQIAETLSSAAVTEIIGVVLCYALKSAVENLSKNNHWPDKPDPSAPAAEPEKAENDL